MRSGGTPQASRCAPTPSEVTKGTSQLARARGWSGSRGGRSDRARRAPRRAAAARERAPAPAGSASGPASRDGEARSPQTGSVSTRRPSISSSTVEWPSQVARRPAAGRPAPGVERVIDGSGAGRHAALAAAQELAQRSGAAPRRRAARAAPDAGCGTSRRPTAARPCMRSRRGPAARLPSDFIGSSVLAITPRGPCAPRRLYRPQSRGSVASRPRPRRPERRDVDATGLSRRPEYCPRFFTGRMHRPGSCRLVSARQPAKPRLMATLGPEDCFRLRLCENALIG